MGDCGWITQLKQQISKRRCYLAADSSVVNVLTSNSALLTTIMGRLLSSRPMLKPYSGEKILSPVKMGPKMAVLGENGGPNLRYSFWDPQKALPGAEPRRLTYFASKSVRARLGCSLSEEPPPKK